MSMAETGPPLRDESQQWKLYTTVSVLMFFVVTSTILRVFTKLRYRGYLTADDYFIILGTVLNIIGDGFDFHAVHEGFGRHSKFLPVESHIRAVKFAELTVMMAAFAIWAIKVSVCFFLLSLLRDTHKRFRHFVWGLMAFTTISTFVSVLLWGLQARPIEKLWDPRVKGTRLSSQDFLNAAYVFFALTAFTDLVYSFTPIWYLWNVQISNRKKYAIWAIMGSGLILTASVCMCIVFAPEFLVTQDITWTLVPLWITDCIQRQLSGIIANLPALYTLACKKLSVPPTMRSTSRYSRASKPWGGKATSDGSAGAKPWARAIVRETNIHVKSVSREDCPQDPYSLEAGTDDHIPLRERTVEFT